MPSTLTLIGDTFQARIGIWKKIVVDKTTQDVNTLLPRHLNEKLCSKNSLSFSFKTTRKRAGQPQSSSHITLSLNLILISPLYVYLSSVSFQIVARVLQPQGVTVGIVNVAESMELAQSMGGYPFNLYLIYLK